MAWALGLQRRCPTDAPRAEPAADRRPAGAHPLDELEAVGAGVVEDLVVGHPAIVAPAWDCPSWEALAGAFIASVSG
jgi:hypothetical protein